METMYYVYILTNEHNTVLYTGVTNDLKRRAAEHKSGVNNGFTKKYNAHKLVYYECFREVKDAITWEKTVKGKSRAWKIALIEKMNPSWEELSDFVSGDSSPANDAGSE